MAAVLQPHFDCLWSPTGSLSPPAWPDFRLVDPRAMFDDVTPLSATTSRPGSGSFVPGDVITTQPGEWHVNHRLANNLCAPPEIDVGGRSGVVHRECCQRLFERTYARDFAGQKHHLYVAPHGDKEPGLVMVTRRDKGREGSPAGYKVLVWTAHCSHVLRVPVPLSEGPNAKLSEADLKAAIVARLRSTCKALKKALVTAAIRVRDRRGGVPSSLQRRLVEFEEKHADFAYPKHFKFGVVCVRPGQETEDEIFGNRDSTGAFDEFLSQLGARIPLEGHVGFAGGLDTRRGTTGEHSVYFDGSSHSGRAPAHEKGAPVDGAPSEVEVMYHVSTLLPYGEKDPQQLQRKRHVGNDVCVIVFLEEGCGPFDPSVFRSHFNHVVCAVRHDGYDAPTPGDDSAPMPRYSVQFAAKTGVPNFGAFTGGAPLSFTKREGLGHYIVAMLAEGQRAALLSPEFLTPILRFRSEALVKLISELVAVPSSVDAAKDKPSPVDAVKTSCESGAKYVEIGSSDSLASNVLDEAVRSPLGSPARRLSAVPDWVSDKIGAFKEKMRRRRRSNSQTAEEDELSSPQSQRAGEVSTTSDDATPPIPRARRKSSPAINFIEKAVQARRRRSAAYAERAVTTPPEPLRKQSGSAPALTSSSGAASADSSPPPSPLRRGDLLRLPVLQRGRAKETDL